ncbi:hypothetical protein BJY52DRAFT_1418590 [Lactarius psammicola]|nr:hypothetical protein BJY52DRAFT_1418590 [Lactarius psammicola]
MSYQKMGVVGASPRIVDIRHDSDIVPVSQLLSCIFTNYLCLGIPPARIYHTLGCLKIQGVKRHPTLICQHYYESSTGYFSPAVFDFRSNGPTVGNPDAIVIAKVTGDIPAPTDNPSAVHWQEMEGISGKLTSTILRVYTKSVQQLVDGSPCEPGTPDDQTKFAAQFCSYQTKSTITSCPCHHPPPPYHCLHPVAVATIVVVITVAAAFIAVVVIVTVVLSPLVAAAVIVLRELIDLSQSRRCSGTKASEGLKHEGKSKRVSKGAMPINQEGDHEGRQVWKEVKDKEARLSMKADV